MYMSTSTSQRPAEHTRRSGIARIAVGVDGYPEGNDAVALGAAIARVLDAELMLVAVHPDPLVVLPRGADWNSVEQQTKAMLVQAREAVGANARIAIETDLSVPRALHRVIRRERRDLLVMGSSRHGAEGHVRIGKRTRQLLCHFDCALAIAPRGLHRRSEMEFRRIGVGYDGGPESEAALLEAGSIAVATGAELHVRGVVDDRIPAIARGVIARGPVAPDMDEGLDDEMRTLRERASAAAKSTGADADVEISCGRPADALLDLCTTTDLMVLGSRRWGPVARVLLGSTGEALLHAGSCSMLVVPRPES